MNYWSKIEQTCSFAVVEFLVAVDAAVSSKLCCLQRLVAFAAAAAVAAAVVVAAAAVAGEQLSG